jgi:hypothetical protein
LMSRELTSMLMLSEMYSSSSRTRTLGAANPEYVVNWKRPCMEPSMLPSDGESIMPLP